MVSHLKSSTRYFVLVVTVVTSVTVVPKPSSEGSVLMWEQVQRWIPVVSSYGGAEVKSLRGTEDEDGCEAKLSTLTGISSQILHVSGLPLSIIWTFVQSRSDPHPARSQIILVDPQKIRTYSNPEYFVSFTTSIFQATGKSETDTACPFPIPFNIIQN